MQFLHPLLCLALFPYNVFAIPAEPRLRPNLRGRSFKVERVRRSDYVPDGPAALQKAYAKFGIIPTSIRFATLDFEPLSSGSSQSASKETGPVGNSPTQNDVEFVSPVTIGGQQFVMNFDSGSSDT